MVSQELLDILRCPVCVHNEPEGGQLEGQGNWLICQDCDRKYPIRDEIPVMLIAEGDRFRQLKSDELPAEPPPEESTPPVIPIGQEQVDDFLPTVLLVMAGLVVGLFFVWLIRNRCCRGNG